MRRALCEELRRWFHGREIEAWIGCDVPVVYDRFTLLAPIAVTLHADPRTRRAWVTAIEGRAVDLVLSIVTRGERLAPLTSAARHVQLGAAESFVFDRHDGALWGFRRDGARIDAIPTTRRGGLRSRVLGAELVNRSGDLALAHEARVGELLDVVDRLDRVLETIQRSRVAATEDGGRARRDSSARPTA